MPKNKKPVPRKAAAPAEPDTDALVQALADLALEVAEGEETDPELAAAREEELLTAIRKALRKKRDEVLYGAIELARYTDPEACRLLRAHIGEQSATLRLRPHGQEPDGTEMEIDAFLIPLFVRSTGGLVAQETFLDDAAYEELAASFNAAELESPGAKVALVRHFYDLAEADHIGYSVLQELLREAAASLGSRKPQAAPLLEASIRGWTGERFAPDETAMELRFLFGFALKRADDPFYAVPRDEIDADVYFADRMRRYRAWAERVAPLVRRCLARDPDSVSVDFLYQDLFHGAKEQGVSELAMLGTLAEINGLLAAKELAPDRVRAVVAPLDAGGHIELRVNLYAIDGGPPWGGTGKAVDLAADLGAEVDELCDALGSIGIDDVSTADGFDGEGHPQGAQPYPAD